MHKWIFPVELCGGEKCGKSQTCVENQDGDRSCECSFNCTNEEQKMRFCTSDGKEYNSYCEVEMQKCLTGKDVEIIECLPGKQSDWWKSLWMMTS